MAPGLPKGNLSSSSLWKLSQDHRISEAKDPSILWFAVIILQMGKPRPREGQ